MSHITKKYRPKTFASVLGQPIAVNSIISSLKANVLPPAYLLHGLRGSGKTTLARLLAMATNCENKQDYEPCGVCQSCKEILVDTSDYLIELDGASHGKVETVRELQDTLMFMVPEGHQKVVIIDECHELSTKAWNAFLKIIEEPPTNTMFVFCTTDYASVKGTIKSRCVQLQLMGVPDTIILKMLKTVVTDEQSKADDKALELITKYSQGSIRDAQSILEGFIRTGNVTEDMVNAQFPTLTTDLLFSYFTKILKKDMKSASYAGMSWMRSGFTPELIITQLVEHLQTMLMDFRINNAGLKTLYKTQRTKIGDDKILDWLDILDDRLRFVKDHPSYYTMLIDSIAIRLIATMTKRTTKTKERQTSNQLTEEVPTPAIPIEKVNSAHAAEFKRACNGSIDFFDPNLNRITIRNDKGTIVDVVSTKEFAINTNYILASDLLLAIKDYPANMAAVAKRKV